MASCWYPGQNTSDPLQLAVYSLGKFQAQSCIYV